MFALLFSLFSETVKPVWTLSTVFAETSRRSGPPSSLVLSPRERAKDEEIGGERGVRTETQNAGGKNAGDFAEPLVNSESFGARFHDARGTFQVPLAPRSLCQNRERRGRQRDSENPGKKATNAKRRERRLSAFRGNWFVPAARCGRVKLPE